MEAKNVEERGINDRKEKMKDKGVGRVVDEKKAKNSGKMLQS